MYDAPRAARRDLEDDPSPVRTSPSAAGWIALAIWAGLAVVAFLGAVGVVAAFSRMTEGLPSVNEFDKISFSQQSVITDRNGVELARFGGERREPVPFEQIPPIVIDAQTAIEDKTFWENAGFDPLAIVSAGLDSIRGNSRGASTITQQLVRQRLLDPKLVADPKRTFERKVKEIIQSVRLTSAFPGVEGKQQIIAAYLNQNYYGNQAYGIKAAAKSYFAVDDLSKLTPAQAAILAGLPKSPSNYDLVKNAEPHCLVTVDDDAECPANQVQMEVKSDSPVVQRRNQILELMASGRTPLSKDQFSPEQLRAAENDPVEVARQTIPHWIAPHFVWAVQAELATKLCGEEPTCDELAAGGLTIRTTLDTKLQAMAEKWVQAAAVVPNTKDPAGLVKKLKLPGYEQWMKNLRGKDVHNGAMVALDYQTGEIIAYVGSASYYSTKPTPQFQPKFDVVGSGFRQPGSAFKPFNYLTGIDDRRITAASMFMDTATDFGGNYTPSDADNLERGPVRVRTALQFSLNIPSVKAAQVNSVDHLFARAQDFGMVFQSEKSNAGLAIALGVQEVRPIDLVTAYGTLANGGKKVGHTTILSVTDQQGQNVVEPYVTPEGEQVASPQAAWIVTDILAGNTTPRINPFWGKFELKGPGNKHRPATLKTGTNNDAKDLNAYGFIAPPKQAERDKGRVRARRGRVDRQQRQHRDLAEPAGVLDRCHDLHVAGLPPGGVERSGRSTTSRDPEASSRPRSIRSPASSRRPAGRRSTNGSSPRPSPRSASPRACAGAMCWVSKASLKAGSRTGCRRTSTGSLARRRGRERAGGVNRTRTAFFYNGAFRPFGPSWGALVAGRGCTGPSPSVTCYPVPTADPSGVVPSFVVPSADPSQNILFEPCPAPSTLPSVSPSAEVSPSVEPSRRTDADADGGAHTRADPDGGAHTRADAHAHAHRRAVRRRGSRQRRSLSARRSRALAPRLGRACGSRRR